MRRAARLALLLALLSSLVGAPAPSHGPNISFPSPERVLGDPDFCGCILDSDW